MNSTEALTLEGQEKMLAVMKDRGSNKIVVVGSGHSAYSVIWMLLNSFDNGCCYTGTTAENTTCSSKQDGQNPGEEEPVFVAGTFGRADITCVYKPAQFSPISEGTQLLYEAIKRHNEPRVCQVSRRTPTQLQW